MNLATGSTLLCKSIKYGTIKEYVKAAASIMGLLGKEINYRCKNPTDKAFCPSLQAVYKKYIYTKLLFYVLSLYPMWVVDPDTALRKKQFTYHQSGFRSFF
jgi:hypothetical protein